jgi:radical SAM superfamily enzyme with C-terminal helix-hairpin-helix motif
MTYALNEQFLARVLAAGLLVRRVNIRQLMPFPGTPAYENNTLQKYDRQFKAFKERARQLFDLPMLRKVFPVGSILRDVIIEISGDLSFGRQMGSYPILAGIPVRLPARTVVDAVVVDWGMRSITALPVPIRINELSGSALKWLPGIGKKNVARIIAKRPFENLEAYRKIAGASPVDHLLIFVK